MDWMNLLTTVWTAMNSPIGITVAAGILAWLLKRVYMAKPLWQAYEGTIIGAIKYAEKAIPDDAEGTGGGRLNAAMKYVLDVYDACGNRSPCAKQRDELREAIGVKHAELEAAGNLPKAQAIARAQGDRHD